MGGRPSEIGEAAKPPSCCFGLPETVRSTFRKTQSGAGAGAAARRGGGRDPPPAADTATAHSGGGSSGIDGIRARRACVEARGSGGRAASDRA